MDHGTILVVDDDEGVRLLYQMEFSDEGYHVIVAENGKEALRMVEEMAPDLVIVDIVMPDMDGMELMPRILRRHGAIPVILNTCYTVYTKDFMTWLADAVVIKSSDLGQLKAKVKEFLPSGHHERISQPRHTTADMSRNMS
jgi:two-component system response regulator (stage 0 sporulation protein F)